MDLATIAVKITADSSQFSSGLKDAESKGQALSGKLDKLVSGAKKLAAAMVFKKGLSSLKSLADETAQLGDKIDKNSQKLGISRKAYQKWDYILSQCGTDIDSMGTAMKTMNQNIEKGSPAIEELGLKFEDLQKLSMEDRFEAIVKQLQEMPDGADKSRIALDLFGKKGQDLMALLNSAPEDIDALKQAFSDLGLEMTDNEIDAAVAYTDAMDTLQRTMKRIRTLIGSKLLPIMTDWAEKAADYAGKLIKAYTEDGGLDGVFKVLNDDITDMTKNMKENSNPVIQALGTIIEGIWKALDIVVGLFTDFPGTVKKLKESDSVAYQILGSVIEAIGNALSWIVENQDTVVLAVGAIIAAFAVGKIIAFVTALNPVTAILGAIAGASALIIANWEGIQQFFEGLWAAVTAAAQSAWDTISGWFSDTLQVVIEWVQKAWDTVSNAFTKAAEWVGKAFKTTVEWVQKAWKTIKDAFNVAKDWVSKKFQTTVEWIQKEWQTISDAFDVATEWVGNVFNVTVEWIRNAWESIKEGFDIAAEWVGNLYNVTVEWVRNAWESIKEGFDTAIEWVGNTYQVTVEWVRNAWNTISSAFSTAAQWVNKSFDVTINFVRGLWNTVWSFIQSIPKSIDVLVNFIKGSDGGGGGHGFAKGNWSVPYDNFPAILHRNEMVLTASQARKYRENKVETEETGSTVGMSGNLAAGIIAAIREGMANAQVNSFLNGKNVTDEVMKIAGNSRSAVRYA